LEKEITERLTDNYLTFFPALRIGGCTLELIQQEEPVIGQNSEEPQEQKADG
jgi:hypothetical protein